MMHLCPVINESTTHRLMRIFEHLHSELFLINKLARCCIINKAFFEVYRQKSNHAKSKHMKISTPPTINYFVTNLAL